MKTEQCEDGRLSKPTPLICGIAYKNLGARGGSHQCGTLHLSTQSEAGLCESYLLASSSPFNYQQQKLTIA